MNNNKCVCCGEIIPEGMQVCYEQTGALGNLRHLELLVLAYKLGVIK